jgi:putative endonuclease
MNKRAKGSIYEYEAATYLTEHGYEIIDQNLNYPRIGELDIVCLKGTTIVIVEVRSREDVEFGHPLESITRPKVKRIIAATGRFLSETKYKYTAVRFDVICFLGDVIEHIENAFYGRFS